MAWKIGGTLGKIGNNIKKMDAGDIALGGLTGGATVAYQAATGDSVKDKVMGALGGVAKPPTIKAAAPDAYQQASNELLNPVADQFQDTANSSQVTSNVDPAFRNYQIQLAQQLQAQASGQGPSLAQMQLQQATNQGLNNSLGLIRASTGANGALGARTAALAGAQQLGNAGLQSGVLRLQEQMAAQNALADLYNQGRSGDMQTSKMDLDAQQYSVDNKLKALAGLGNIRGRQVDTAGDVYTAQNNAAMGQATARNQRDNQILGALVTGGATIAGTMFGGPVGAVAGNAAGQAVAGQVAKK